MLDATARRLLDILGKDTTGHGIITVEQIPGAIAALEQAVQREEEQRAAAKETQDADEDAQRDEAPAGAWDPVSLRQRTAPFLDMLKRSAAQGREVTW
ncbi:DUF1840 domain-containing protein [Comamonas endophytica]